MSKELLRARPPKNQHAIKKSSWGRLKSKICSDGSRATDESYRLV